MLPREKLTELGVESLTDDELLAIMLGSGSARENVFELSRRIVAEPGFQKSLLEQQSEYWTKISGIGPIKASRLVAGVELTKRMIFKKTSIRRVTKAHDIFELLRPIVLGKNYECFYVVCLSTKNEVLLTKEIHRGFCNQVVVDMKMLFSTILQTGALSFVCAHNHPSHDVEPSHEDQILTQKIAQASKVLDLNFLDHIIITPTDHHSLFANTPNLFDF